jgi:hypothetical protein
MSHEQPWVLHIANKNYSSCSLRPWVLVRELGIPFNERLSPFHDASQRSFGLCGDARWFQYRPESLRNELRPTRATASGYSRA